MVSDTSRLRLPVIAAAIAINVTLAVVVQALKLPIYLDAVGTIIATLLLGWRMGILVGAVSFVLASFVISPPYIYFIGTQAVIAVTTYLAAKHLRAFSSLWRVVPFGITLGVIAGVVSAPVIVIVFGGATGTGRDLLTAVIASSGQRIVESVFLSGLASEPLDKTLQALLAWSVLRSFPRSLLSRFASTALERNFPNSQ